MRALASQGFALVLLLAAWHANVEALPLHTDADGVDLGDAAGQTPAAIEAQAPMVGRSVITPKARVKGAPETVDTKIQASRVSKSQQAVEQALAAVHGDVRGAVVE